MRLNLTALGAGGDDSYLKLDIDGDNVEDQVIRSCGANLDSTCTLFVVLSNGTKLEIEEDRFFLVRVKSVPYIVVGDGLSEPEEKKQGKRRIYEITTKSINLICPHL